MRNNLKENLATFHVDWKQLHLPNLNLY